MEKWYISINSKARGPFSEGQIRQKVQKGDLTSETLIYKEGDLDWLPLKEQSLWSPMLNEDQGHSFTPSKDSKVWVLLVENPLKKGDFLQEGPFNQSSVIEKFDIGEVQETDYVWRPGMKKWSLIKDMPELVMARKQAKRFAEDEVKTVHASDLETPKKSKLFDSYADMPVFIEPYSKREVEDLSLEPLRPLESSPEDLKIKRLPSLFKGLSQKKEITWFLVSIAAVFILGLSIGFVKPEIFSSFKNTKRAVYSLFSPSYTASYLMISPSIVDKKIIRFRSDAKPGALIKVSVFNLSGQKMRLLNSSSKSTSVRIDAVGVGEVDLSAFDLNPFKNYSVVAKMGGLEAKKSVIYVP